jgi:hypothetical protein
MAGLIFSHEGFAYLLLTSRWLLSGNADVNAMLPTTVMATGMANGAGLVVCNGGTSTATSVLSLVPTAAPTAICWRSAGFAAPIGRVVRSRQSCFPPVPPPNLPPCLLSLPVR